MYARSPTLLLEFGLDSHCNSLLLTSASAAILAARKAMPVMTGEDTSLCSHCLMSIQELSPAANVSWRLPASADGL